MPTLPHLSPHLLVAYAAYLVLAASPGPSILAIMDTAMRAGRKPALALSAGVMTGSVFWSVLAALGLATLLAKFSAVLLALKVLGGIYLLWLGFRSALAAMSSHEMPEPDSTTRQASYLQTYLRGAALHFTNPKAIFVWLSTVTLALPEQAAPGDTLAVVVGCWIIGCAVFGGYAMAFSTPVARAAYRRAGKWLDGSLALVFGYAGVRMLIAGATRT